MHDMADNLGVKNMSDLTINAIKGIFKTKTPTKEQTGKYKRHAKEVDNDLTRIYIHEDFSLSIIMDCRMPASIEFRIKLGFNQHDLMMTKEQSVLTKIIKVFSSEEVLL